MRARKVGGYEPDDRDQQELVELWHTSRTAIAVNGEERRKKLSLHGTERSWRLSWVVDEFIKAHDGHPNVAFKWVYNWCAEHLGRHVEELVNDVDGKEIDRRWGR